jgi:hypothetical protein
MNGEPSAPCVQKMEADEAWDAAQKALEEAQNLPAGVERIEALKRAGKLRLEASRLLLARE